MPDRSRRCLNRNHGVSQRQTHFGAQHFGFQEFELTSEATSLSLLANLLAKPDFRLGSWLALAGRARPGRASRRIFFLGETPPALQFFGIATLQFRHCCILALLNSWCNAVALMAMPWHCVRTWVWHFGITFPLFLSWPSSGGHLSRVAYLTDRGTLIIQHSAQRHPSYTMLCFIMSKCAPI